MKKEITSQDQELAQFGYKLAAALKESLRMTFLDTQETNKFSPQVFNIFSIESIEKNVDNSMATDGVFYLSSDTKGRNYYVDTHIGLIYVLCDGIYSVVAHSCTSKQYDVFDAAYLRRCILNPDYRNPLLLSSGVNGYKEITSLDYMGYKLKDIFFASIPEYTVSTKKELKELISDLTSLLSQSKFFRKLWFRGQRKEYTITRSKETLRKLGLPLSFEIMPALVPSLGRDIEHKNFDEMMTWAAFPPTPPII